MSYVIVTSMSVSNNGKDIYVTGDDNNVFPKDYKRLKFNGELIDLLYDLWGGSLQPTRSANNGKAYYISRIIVDEIKVGWGEGNSSERVRTIIREKRLEQLFLRLWNNKTKSKERYKVMYGNSCVIKIKKYGFSYGSGNCKIFNFYQAMNTVNDNKKRNLQMVKI